MSTELGRAIATYRERRGMTVTALANELGITKSHLSAMERGRVGVPTIEVRRRLARMLGISHVALLVMTGELSPEEADPALMGVPAFSPGDPRAKIVELLPGVSDDDLGAVQVVVERLANRGRQ